MCSAHIKARIKNGYNINTAIDKPRLRIERSPIIHTGVRFIWEMSKRLQSSVWFLRLANMSNSSSTKTTGWLFSVPVRNDSKRNCSFSSKEPNTMSSTTFSSLSWRVISSRAMLSSVCSRPCSRTCKTQASSNQRWGMEVTQASYCWFHTDAMRQMVSQDIDTIIILCTFVRNFFFGLEVLMRRKIMRIIHNVIIAGTFVSS